MVLVLRKGLDRARLLAGNWECGLRTTQGGCRKSSLSGRGDFTGTPQDSVLAGYGAARRSTSHGRLQRSECPAENSRVRKRNGAARTRPV